MFKNFFAEKNKELLKKFILECCLKRILRSASRVRYAFDISYEIHNDGALLSLVTTTTTTAAAATTATTTELKRNSGPYC
jgi:hypothetical protein